MNKQFKAVSMDCTQEQFEQLRPHLEKIEGIDFSKDLDPDYNSWRGIANNYDGINLAIGAVSIGNTSDRTYIGAFNAKAFIEACGGEWVEEKTSMKGKWFKYVAGSTASFTKGKWYQFVADNFEDPCAFLDNKQIKEGYSGSNHRLFDLSNPMDFNPDTAAMAAPQPETKFKEVPFSWETYLQYKDKGAYLEYCDKEIAEAHKFTTPNMPYPIVIAYEGTYLSFTNEGFQLLNGKDRLKLFIPTTKKTITVWVLIQGGEAVGATEGENVSKRWRELGHNVIELTKEIEL